jgi:UDP-N-acetylmuramoyl-tripeptide--D-alanyl-D-alanine ligase
MRELGLASAEHHRAIGALAAQLGFSPIVGVGEEAELLLSAARDQNPRCATRYCDHAEAAAAAAAALVQPGDVVLVKGSRGVGLERVTRALAPHALAPHGEGSH